MNEKIKLKISQIKKQVANNMIDTALMEYIDLAEFLREETGYESFENDLILLQAQFKELKQLKRSGTEPTEKVLQMSNKLRGNIIESLSDFENAILQKNTMEQLGSVKRIATIIKVSYKSNKVVRNILRFIYSTILLILGATIYALLFEKVNLAIPSKLGIIGGVVGAIISFLILVIDKVFNLELTEKKLRLAEMEVSEKSPKELAKSIAKEIIPILGRELSLPDSVFFERAQHYKKEKQFISIYFAKLLIDRIDFLLQHHEKIRIIFDAGTTIAPIIDKIVADIVEKNKDWYSKVIFITNNIHGTNSILKYRMYDKDELERTAIKQLHHKNIPIECFVLPGQIEAAYQAIADKHTLEALKFIQPQKHYTVCISTGNYLMYDRKENIFPIARTRFHPHVKSGLFWIADEIFLVAPLGKILISKKEEPLDKLLERFNKNLNYSHDTSNPENEAYQLTDDKLLDEFSFKKEGHNRKNWMKKTTLFTTSRQDKMFLLNEHSNFISNTSKLKNYQAERLSSEVDGPYIRSIDFSDIPLEKESQIEFEFPHENLREIRKDYFL